MSEKKPKFVRGLNSETIYPGDIVIDTRPDGQRGIVTALVSDSLASVRIGHAAYDITIAARHLARVIDE